MSFDIIRRGRGNGKTTEALKQLDAMGGGLFITNNPQEVARVAARLELKNKENIKILNPKFSPLVIDDADGPMPIILTMNETKAI